MEITHVPHVRPRTRRLTAVPLAVVLLAGCAPEPRNLVLVSLDTVRRDHLPTYGYPRPTAPTIEALARRGVVFTNAFSQEVNTAPSHASMFTGLYPHQHGCVSNAHPLDPEPVTLAERLRAAGFRTGGFVSGVPMNAALSALHRGFEVWDDRLSGSGRRRDGRSTARAAMRWLRGLPEGERFFLFLHLYDPHGPYRPPHAYAKRFVSPEPGPRLERIPEYQRLRDARGRPRVHLNEYVDRYDAMIRYADDRLASLLEFVDLEETAVLVVADHGETLAERYHALDHGGQLFDEQIRIPLILSAPGLEPGRVPAMVETVDLLPTLLALLGAPPVDAAAIEGRDLLPVLGGDGDAPGRERVYATARADDERHADRGYRLDASRPILSVRSPRWKLIRYPSVDEDPVELYDLAADPGETRNVAERFPEERDAHLALLRRWHDGAAPAAVDLPPELREGLRSLGYVE